MTKRVLFICPNGEFGGAERTALNLATELTKRGHWLAEVALLRRGNLESELLARKIPVHIVEGFRLSRPLTWPRVVRKLIEIIRTNRIDLVHAEMAYGQIVAGILRIFTKTPSLWYQHGPVAKHSPQQVFAAALPTQGYLTNSNYTLSRQPRIRTPHLCSILPPPVGREFLDSELNQEHRNKLEIMSDETLVLLPARFQARVKGQSFAISAFAETAKLMPKTRLLLVGAPEEMHHRDYPDFCIVRAQAEQINRECGRDTVLFAPFDRNIVRWMDAADIVLSSTLIPEAFGCTLVEAMIRRRIVIAPSQGGILDIAAFSPGLFLYEPSNAQSLANALKRAILLSPKERHRIGNLNHESATRFSVDKLVPKLEAFYEAVSSPKSGASS